MKPKKMHPAEQLAQAMRNLYGGGLTTASGGNLSILDSGGDIWITPSGVDKGMLRPEDICRVTPDGGIHGPYKPSIELPFHKAIYRCRPDIRAVLHAHPPALVAFSAARTRPDTRLAAELSLVAGEAAMAPYAAPGAPSLGNSISEAFAKGYHSVLMANHGVVVGADCLFAATARFEALEMAAAIEIYAKRLGTPKALRQGEIDMAAAAADDLPMDTLPVDALPVDTSSVDAMPVGASPTLASPALAMPTFAYPPVAQSPQEGEARRTLAAWTRRAYRRKLITSAVGICSVRIGGGFLITPRGGDRANMEEGDLVLIRGGGKPPTEAMQGQVSPDNLPSDNPSPRLAALHQAIYARRPDIHALMGGCPPHAMAFAVTGAPLDVTAMSESYMLLRHIPVAPFRATYADVGEAAGMLSPSTPVMIFANSHILAGGSSLPDAFRLLETAEAAAASLLLTGDIAPPVPIA
ncbi:MAG: class II aldolase/adducin family protein [Oscillospiraceae bacterium]|nr:class II aldolase/adducin family protein [Oscillospiraceae bacterium]